MTIAPDYRVIAIEETDNWDRSVTAITGRIAGVYVVNFSEVTHLCSLSGSYYGQFLRNITEHYVRGPDGYNSGKAVWDDEWAVDHPEEFARSKALLETCGKDWDELQYDNGGEDGSYFEQRSLDPAKGSPIDMEGAGWTEDACEMSEEDVETYRRERDESAYEAARQYESNGEEWDDLAPWNREKEG